MYSFKEWLSDYLRYFVLLLAVLLAVGAIVLGVKLYQNAQETRQTQGNSGDIQIITSTETEAASDGSSETESNAAETQETLGAVTEKATEPQVKQTETKTTEKTQESGQSEETVETRQTETKQTEKTSEGRQSERPAETRQTETKAPETDPPQTEPPKPVYLTMTGTCYFRSYADYGDNIIGEYPAGTVVEFLEDVGGWYKVQVDGMVGYMGARFFQ